MKTFLVPIDFSAVTDDVVDTAIDFTRAFGGKAALLHVVQPPVITSDFALPAEMMQEALDATEKAATKKLAEYVARFREAGLEASADIQHGPPATLIAAEAERVKADFVIMGSHGHGKLYDLLVGSTSAGVMKRVKAGVILLPPGDREY